MSSESSIGSVSRPLPEAPRPVFQKPAALNVVTDLGQSSSLPPLWLRARTAATSAPVLMSSPPTSSPHSFYVSREDDDLFMAALPRLNEDTVRASRSSHESPPEERTHPFAAAIEGTVAELPRLRHATLFRGHSSPSASVVRVLPHISSVPETAGPSSGVTLFSESSAPRASEVTSVTPPTHLWRHTGEDTSQDAPAVAPAPIPVVPPVPVQTAPVAPRHSSWFCC